MIATTITGNVISQHFDDGKLEVPVSFTWFETDKKRMLKVAEDGTEIGVMVGQTIKDGDVLFETGDKRYFARIATAQLIRIPVHTMKEMGRLCFELGNRHLSIKVEDDQVLVPYDYPTMEYTKKIGFEPELCEGDFDGFLIVKAHAGTGTLIPGTNKTTGDMEEEEQESQADAQFESKRAGNEHVSEQAVHNHHTHDHNHAETAESQTPVAGEHEINGVLHRPDGSHSHDGGRTWHTH